ncbi:hypothetical protein GWK47_002846 [Chionoecetes opilio]|uniref:Uncharacterized protein n=1 Tax=Chionoecetes opilio TaxID=41210 RepID=A0A8J4XPG7_CHIOP|nr:hypothetical protein GWK47_002846 [Chionoecetes opilio]
MPPWSLPWAAPRPPSPTHASPATPSPAIKNKMTRVSPMPVEVNCPSRQRLPWPRTPVWITGLQASSSFPLAAWEGGNGPDRDRHQNHEQDILSVLNENWEEEEEKERVQSKENSSLVNPCSRTARVSLSPHKPGHSPATHCHTLGQAATLSLCLLAGSILCVTAASSHSKGGCSGH